MHQKYLWCVVLQGKKKTIRREKTKTASGNGFKFVGLWLARIFRFSNLSLFKSGFGFATKWAILRTDLIAEKSLLGFLSFPFIEKFEKGFEKLFSRKTVAYLHA